MCVYLDDMPYTWYFNHITVLLRYQSPEKGGKSNATSVADTLFWKLWTRRKNWANRFLDLMTTQFKLKAGISLTFSLNSFKFRGKRRIVFCPLDIVPLEIWKAWPEWKDYHGKKSFRNPLKNFDNIIIKIDKGRAQFPQQKMEERNCE